MLVLGGIDGYDSPGRADWRAPGFFCCHRRARSAVLLASPNQGIQIMIHGSRLLLATLGAILGLALWFQNGPSVAQDKNKPADKAADKEKPAGKKIAMQAFMRKKLESSQSVLEGLALED